MTKKIIGICLLVLGGVLFLWTSFLWTSYGLVKNLTTSREEQIEQTKTMVNEEGISSYFSDEQIEKMVDDSRKYGLIIPPIMMLIAGGIAFGGFALFKRGKKDEQLSDTFKF